MNEKLHGLLWGINKDSNTIMSVAKKMCDSNQIQPSYEIKAIEIFPLNKKK